MSTAARRVLAAGGLSVAVLIGWARPAAAHAQLESTEPAAGAVLRRSPGRVVLRFGEPVEIQFGAVRVFDASARRIDTGESYHPAGNRDAVATNLAPSLATGGYVVTWRVISADSHPVHGAFTFDIGPLGAGPAASVRALAARLLSAGRGSSAVGAVFAVVRFADFAALLSLLGATAFVALAWMEGSADGRTRRLLWACWAAVAGTTVLSVALQGPYGGALPLVDAVRPSVLLAVLHTRYGEVYAARLAILGLSWLLLRVLLAPVGPEPPGRRLPGWWVPAAGLAALGLLATTSLAGHAAAGSQVALAVPVDMAHLGAAGTWLGGLALMAAAVLPGAPAGAEAVVARFSQWAFGSVLVLVVTAGYLAWRQVGTMAAVAGTPYGRLLLAKTLAFTAMLGLAALSRRFIHRRLALPVGSPRRPAAALSRGPGAMASDARKARTSALCRSVVGELAIGAIVLALTALLVSAQPARAALARPFTTEVHAGRDLLVDVVVDPAKAGPVTLHLYVLNIDGAQADVGQVTAVLTPPTAEVGPIQVPLPRAGAGHFLAAGLDLAIRGIWTLHVFVPTSAGQVYAQPVLVPIR